jgi:thiol-disulfide isomerase/thioredoxin
MKQINQFILAFVLFAACGNAAAQDIPKWKLGDLRAAIEQSDRPTIVNFWASFCKPCVAEIPGFQEELKKWDSAGIRLILVSLDLPDDYAKLPAFAKRFKFDTKAIVFLDETNADLFCPVADPKWSGAIPATLFINGKTGYRQFVEDALTKEKFGAEVRKLVGAHAQ